MSDETLKVRALRLIGAAENLTAEIVHEAAGDSEEVRASMQHLVSYSEDVAHELYAGRRDAPTWNRECHAYMLYWNSQRHLIAQVVHAWTHVLEWGDEDVTRGVRRTEASQVYEEANGVEMSHGRTGWP